MGANIPLPALAINPQQQQDPLASIKNILALRNLQTQQQMQQGQLALQPGQQAIQGEQVKQEQIATTKAQLELQDIQGINGAMASVYGPQEPAAKTDVGFQSRPSAASPITSQSGALQIPAAAQGAGLGQVPNVTPNPQPIPTVGQKPTPLADAEPQDRLQALQQAIMNSPNISPMGKMKEVQQFNAMQEGLGKASDEQTKALQDYNSLAARHLQTVLDAPPEQRAAQWQEEAQNIMRNPIVQNNPTLRAGLASILPTQYPGDQKAQQVLMQLRVEKDALDAAKIAGIASENKEKAQKADIVQQLSTPEALVNPGTLAAIQAKMQDPTTAKEDIPRLQALIPQATAAARQAQGFKVGVAAAEGAARANVEAQMARGSNAALAQVPPHLVAPATAEATKLGTDYATVASQLANVKSGLTAAKNGDEVASAFAPVAAALGSNSFYGTHRIMPAEVQALGPGLGSVAREVNTWFDKHATGTLAPDSIKEFNALVDRLGSAAQDKYENGLKIANQNYGSTFKPLTIEAKPQAQTTAPRILTMDDIRQAARDNKVTVDQALAAAKAQGHTVQQ